MPVRASIEPLTWENAFFGVNSAIVRITSEAPLLTPDALAPWSRVQAKIAASNTGELDALQQLGFSLVEGEVDLALPVNNVGDSGAEVAQETDIPALRQLASAALRKAVFVRRGMRLTPAVAFMHSGLKMPCAAPLIINV